MLNLNVYNRQGESVGSVEIDPAEFGGSVNRQLLHDVVVMHLANQRAGHPWAIHMNDPWVTCRFRSDWQRRCGSGSTTMRCVAQSRNRVAAPGSAPALKTTVSISR